QSTAIGSESQACHGRAVNSCSKQHMTVRRIACGHRAISRTGDDVTAVWGLDDAIYGRVALLANHVDELASRNFPDSEGAVISAGYQTLVIVTERNGADSAGEAFDLSDPSVGPRIVDAESPLVIGTLLLLLGPLSSILFTRFVPPIATDRD